jgi:hypothetical protein
MDIFTTAIATAIVGSIASLGLSFIPIGTQAQIDRPTWAYRALGWSFLGVLACVVWVAAMMAFTMGRGFIEPASQAEYYVATIGGFLAAIFFGAVTYWGRRRVQRLGPRSR